MFLIESEEESNKLRLQQAIKNTTVRNKEILDKYTKMYRDASDDERRLLATKKRIKVELAKINNDNLKKDLDERIQKINNNTIKKLELLDKRITADLNNLDKKKEIDNRRRQNRL